MKSRIRRRPHEQGQLGRAPGSHGRLGRRHGSFARWLIILFMAHMTSAAALHAARTVLREYAIEVRPERRLSNQAADERCLAIVIDLTSNAWRVCEVRPELRYWRERLHHATATAENIGNFFNRVLEAFESVPAHPDDERRIVTTLETPREFGGPPLRHVMSRFAVECSAMVFHHYLVARRKPGFVDGSDVLDRVCVAKLVDTGLGLTRAMAALPVLRSCKAELKAGRATEKDTARCLRRVELMLEYLSSYEDRNEEVRIL